ncbi:hypothetical protein KUTeg_000804 [Tegillarca granosa]|uniref:Uncharacterized protein n=1 Tax=Tegillarca granosa TaxID=220873 RepID=A0ABQ9G2X7_TEGGR|nr:hypothetical protein KUTeg_000804 [Tegillarca granosa]
MCSNVQYLSVLMENSLNCDHACEIGKWFLTVQEFLPAMLEKNKGHIVTIASMSAKSGTALLVDYSASKYAAYGFTEALNEEIWRYGKDVKTTTVCPMFVGTGLVKYPKLGRGKLLTPQEVAMATVNGTLTNQEEVIVPPALEYQLKITQFFPRKFNVWAKRAQNIGLDPQYEPGSKQD